MLCIATLNPSTPSNHFPYYIIRCKWSLSPPHCHYHPNRIYVALPLPTDTSTCAPSMSLISLTTSQASPRSLLSLNASISQLSASATWASSLPPH
ncbi:uncharacterized protein DS421_6g191900 [Arachis hypogaea]|nr:uncharacterized protein DS421_6g191900 [Arachis hypogaea]